MARSYAVIQGRTAELRKGVGVAHIRCTLGATTDYDATNGIPISSEGQQFGFSEVWGVASASIRDAAGTTLRTHRALFNFGTGRLLFIEESDGTLIEQADLTNGDLVDMVVIGVC